MPIYEYQCKKCGEEFECIVFGNEKPGCPSCQSKNICKNMSACGFISRGSSGQTTSRSAGASGCGGCSASSCAGCSH